MGTFHRGLSSFSRQVPITDTPRPSFAQPVVLPPLAAFGDDDDEEEDLTLNATFLNAFMNLAHRRVFLAIESLPSFEDTLVEKEAS